jgi:hypothetical protein
MEVGLNIGKQRGELDQTISYRVSLNHCIAFQHRIADELEQGGQSAVLAVQAHCEIWDKEPVVVEGGIVEAQMPVGNGQV